MTQPKLIQDDFNYGKGDDGQTQAQAGCRLPKSNPDVQAYNKLEKWVFALSDAVNNIEGHADARVRMARAILKYLRDKAYVIGAMFYSQSEDWSLDEELLRWIRLEIQTMDGKSHNFINPAVEHTELRTLEWLRIETRELESYMWYVCPYSTINHQIVNRLSSYIYQFSNYLRTQHLNEDLNETEWNVKKNPKFEEYRT